MVFWHTLDKFKIELNFLFENIRIGIRVQKTISYGNYITILPTNSTQPPIGSSGTKETLTYPSRKNDMNFQNNLSAL